MQEISIFRYFRNINKSTLQRVALYGRHVEIRIFDSVYFRFCYVVKIMQMLKACANMHELITYKKKLPLLRNKKITMICVGASFHGESAFAVIKLLREKQPVYNPINKNSLNYNHCSNCIIDYVKNSSSPQTICPFINHITKEVKTNQRNYIYCRKYIKRYCSGNHPSYRIVY